MMRRCKELEDKLIALVWKDSRAKLDGPRTPSIRSNSGYEWTGTINGSMFDQESKNGSNNVPGSEKAHASGMPREAEATDNESGAPSKRATRMFAPVYNGLGAALGLALTLEGLRKLLIEYWTDGSLTRFSLIVTFPLLFCVSLVCFPLLLPQT
jgi:hypothetical protein